MNTKNKMCTRCKADLPASMYTKDRQSRDGLFTYCKTCSKEVSTISKRQKKNMPSVIYNKQRMYCRKRSDPYPEYTKKWLAQWLFNQPLFHTLYDNWVRSNYAKDLVISVDRDNPMGHYTKDNIVLMTWQENNAKGTKDMYLGKDTKQLRGVIQLDLEDNVINTFASMSIAARETGIRQSTIGNVCRSTRYHTAGGYKWQYIKK